ncbi:hypothetical protein GCM10023191_022780 [Actinoallomurus oryzae]|uniref:Uncharacterized protein n=1 Tax=Actinoallomurus oryzae TaxID=502180 RepID=A0ABP8PS87_9ACTN
MTYGAASVAHWLAGVMPRPETIPIAAEAFARALNQPGLRAANLGWGVRGQVRPLASDLLVCDVVVAAVMEHGRGCVTERGD